MAGKIEQRDIRAFCFFAEAAQSRIEASQVGIPDDPDGKADIHESWWRRARRRRSDFQGPPPCRRRWQRSARHACRPRPSGKERCKSQGQVRSEALHAQQFSRKSIQRTTLHPMSRRISNARAWPDQVCPAGQGQAYLRRVLPEAASPLRGRPDRQGKSGCNKLGIGYVHDTFHMILLVWPVGGAYACDALRVRWAELHFGQTNFRAVLAKRTLRQREPWRIAGSRTLDTLPAAGSPSVPDFSFAHRIRR